MPVRPISLFALLLLSAACAPQPVTWHKANASAEDLRQALAQCRAYAMRDAERNILETRTYSSRGGFGGQSTYQRNMDAYRAKKDSADLLGRCMRLNGFSRGR